MRETIFMVDDSVVNLTIVEKGLREYYSVVQIPSGKILFELLEEMTPSLILLDIVMPVMDGFEVLAQLKQDVRYCNIPVIFLTARSDEETETRGFNMGVVDFVSKPFSIPILLNRLSLHINLDNIVKKRTSSLEKLHRNQLYVLASIIESRDINTAGHVTRTSNYVRALIDGMLARDVYATELMQWDIETCAICAALHDAGKLYVPDQILNKKGKLTNAEMDIVKAHTTKGADLINSIINVVEEDIYLENAFMFAEFHHENWDGTGYPHGLSGTKIPLQGRIMAIADVYDSLVNDRAYKTAMPHEQAVRVMMDESGRKFDTRIANVFFAIREKFREINEQSVREFLV